MRVGTRESQRKVSRIGSVINNKNSPLPEIFPISDKKEINHYADYLALALDNYHYIMTNLQPDVKNKPMWTHCVAKLAGDLDILKKKHGVPG